MANVELPKNKHSLIPLQLILKPKEENKMQDELEWEAEVDTYATTIAELAVQENIVESNLLTSETLKENLKQEFMEALLMNETKHTLDQAIEILNEEEITYPNQERWKLIISEFKSAVVRLNEETINPVPETEKTLQEKANLSDSALDLIEELAKKRYGEGDYQSCKTLFVLLSILNNRRFENWQRLGAILQELKEYEKAIHAYDNAWMIRQDVIANRLFIAECYLELKNKIKAEEFCEAARQLVETQNAMDTWRRHLTALERAIRE